MSTDEVTTAGPIFDARNGSLMRRLAGDARTLIGVILVSLVVALALAGPTLAPYTATEFAGLPLQAPGGGLLLGADVLGRDVWSQLLLGGRTYLLEGFAAAVLGVGTGTLLGLALGSLRGRLGALLLFGNDSIMVIPQIVVVLIIVTVFGATPISLILAVALAQVTHTARLVRAATLRVIDEDYVLAARAAGQEKLGLMVSQVLPNIAGPVLVEFGVRLSVSFVVLASLSYLGLGGAGVAWGAMIHDNQGALAIQPWAALAPVIAIALFLIGMNLVRDGISRAVAARSAR